MATRFRLLLLSVLTISSLPATTINFTTFTTPPVGVNSNGTIGFAYAGDKFVGSVYHSGLNTLYSTDLNGGSQQVFAPPCQSLVEIRKSTSSQKRLRHRAAF